MYKVQLINYNLLVIILLLDLFLIKLIGMILGKLRNCYKVIF